MKYSTRACLLIACIGFALGMEEVATAGVVYKLDLNNGYDIRQQAGNNQYFYGDDVTLLSGSPQRLESITLSFALFTLDGTGSYTPDLSLSIFEIDQSSRKPIGTALGTANRSNVTFVGGNFNASTPLAIQNVTFNFAGLPDLILPTNFAFAYRDNSLGSRTPPGSGFSVVFQPSNAANAATVGSTVNGILAASPNSFNDPNGSNPPSYTFQFGAEGFGTANGNLVATIQATAVPEPSMFAMGLTVALFGLGFALRHRAATDRRLNGRHPIDVAAPCGLGSPAGS